MATAQTHFYKTANARSRCSVQTQKTFFDNFAMLARILAYSSMNFKNWVVFQSMDLYFSDSTSEAYDADDRIWSEKPFWLSMSRGLPDPDAKKRLFELDVRCTRDSSTQTEKLLRWERSFPTQSLKASVIMSISLSNLEISLFWSVRCNRLTKRA